jgi:hypothetical protein
MILPIEPVFGESVPGAAAFVDAAFLGLVGVVGFGAELADGELPADAFAGASSVLSLLVGAADFIVGSFFRPTPGTVLTAGLVAVFTALSGVLAGCGLTLLATASRSMVTGFFCRSDGLWAAFFPDGFREPGREFFDTMILS